MATGMPSAAAAAPGHGTVTAWWELPEPARDLREHLIEHLLAAGRAADADELAADLRWAGARLELSGPAGPYADLARIGTPRAQRLARVLGQAAHLLAPADPPHSLIDILYSRVSRDPDWGAQAQALTASRKLPALISKWPLPDLPHPALQRALTGHTSGVSAVAIAPDGTWLATASDDGSVRIWDPATGQQRAALTGHTGDGERGGDRPGRHLARHRRGDDGSVRMWDPATGQQRAALTGHTDGVNVVAIAPDGTWLATAGDDGTVRIWDPATGRQRAALTGHTGAVSAVAIAPDGTWLATARRRRAVRIWDPATGRQRAALTGHTGSVSAVAIAPDGTWLATGGDDGTVRIWDPATGQQRATLTGHTGHGARGGDRPGRHLAGHRQRRRDGADLGPGHRAAARRPHRPHRPGERGGDRPGRHLARHRRQRRDGADLGPGRRRIDIAVTGRIDTRRLRPGRRLAGHRRSGDGSVRIWDPATGQQRAALTGHTGRVSAVAIAPDGTWLATAGGDGSVRIWDPATGKQRATLTGHTGWVRAVAIAPDGAWLATGGDDGTVRIWDPATGRQRATLTGHTGPGR